MIQRFACLCRSLGALFSILVVGGSPALAADSDAWEPLLDPELGKWERYLSFRHKSGYDGAPPLDAKRQPELPIGYNLDPAGVFTTLLQDSETILRVSGEYYGCLFTKEEFENYRLRLKVKWGAKKWEPRKELLRDTGILYHSQGEAGVDYWRSWMLAQEFQIMEGHMGDYWNIANSAIDIRAFLPEGAMNSVASERQPFFPFGSGDSVSGFCLRSEDAESPANEWTELELVCFGGKSLHIVNGRVVMILQNSRFVEGDEATPLVRGRIQLQSEAAEAFFRDVFIRRIHEMPAEFARYFE